MEDYTAENILDYLDEHGDKFSTEDFKAIAVKIYSIQETRRNKKCAETAQDVENSIKHLFELGGYAIYNGGRWREKYYFTAKNFFEDIQFKH